MIGVDVTHRYPNALLRQLSGRRSTNARGRTGYQGNPFCHTYLLKPSYDLRATVT